MIELINPGNIRLCLYIYSKKMREICWNIWIKAQKKCRRHLSGVLIVNFEEISEIASTINFEQFNAVC